MGCNSTERIKMDEMMQEAQPVDAGMELGQQGGEQAAGYTICITVNPDNTMTVSTEPAEPQEGGTPAKSIAEALAMALEIFKAGGQMPDPAQAEQSMAAGFNKVKQVGM
jgi:hypothetical protein